MLLIAIAHCCAYTLLMMLFNILVYWYEVGNIRKSCVSVKLLNHCYSVYENCASHILWAKFCCLDFLSIHPNMLCCSTFFYKQVFNYAWWLKVYFVLIIKKIDELWNNQYKGPAFQYPTMHWLYGDLDDADHIINSQLVIIALNYPLWILNLD